MTIPVNNTFQIPLCWIFDQHNIFSLMDRAIRLCLKNDTRWHSRKVSTRLTLLINLREHRYD